MTPNFRPLLLAGILFVSALAISCRSVEASREPIPDDTAYIQSLLDSPGDEIAVPAGIWHTGPLFITVSHKRITFAEGCTLLAKKGSFTGTGDCLLTIRGAEGLRIEGKGARFVMRRRDYDRAPYRKGEWRHGIAVYACRNVVIEGLAVENTGGDGVYIGQKRGEPVCEDITLSGLALADNYRQGVSVIAARGFLMENCRVSGTKGTLPMAGIDFEPNSGAYGFTGCVLRNCTFTGNSGPGILVYLKKLTAENPPIDIRVENSESRRNRLSVSILEIPEGLGGEILFSGCSLSWFKYVSVPESLSVRFE